MLRKALGTMVLVVSVIPVLAWAHAGTGSVVDVRIVSDSGCVFAQYRIPISSLKT